MSQKKDKGFWKKVTYCNNKPPIGNINNNKGETNMASLTKDDVWKVFSLIMSVLVLPLAGWVWNTNIKVAELQNDLGDAEVVLATLEKKRDQYEAKEVELASQIIGIEKDIEYMKGSLGRIEQMVTSK